MTYVVDENCIKCKHMDCVDVCPVDCFYEGENMLVINPDECIDCGVCEPECPIDAIKADTDESVKGMEKWLLLNKKFSAIWPNINKKKDPMPEHKKYEKIKNKLKIDPSIIRYLTVKYKKLDTTNEFFKKEEAACTYSPTLPAGK